MELDISTKHNSQIAANYLLKSLANTGEVVHSTTFIIQECTARDSYQIETFSPTSSQKSSSKVRKKKKP